MENCVCYNGDFEKCPYIGAVHTVEIQGFKGEENELSQRCDYQKYVGPALIMSNFTRAEFNQILFESTLCTYNK